MSETWMVAGVLIAMLGPAAIALYGTRVAARPGTLRTNLTCQAMLAALVGAILSIVVLAENRPLASLGLRWPSVSTFLWALGMSVFLIGVLGPVLLRLPVWLGLPDFERTLADLARLPVWYLAVAVIIGGIAEEILYRGYALERLTAFLGNGWLAGALVVALFGVAHIPLWGVGPALTTMVSGAALTAFFLWHGDLVANILAHVATDFVGIVLGPLLMAARRRE
jgi:membrane protease YdiL (CAAX protease family)